ncbi:MAG: redoxin domain-containing protein [Emticicia sp.]|uniref:redoxin domain-containing protein n=1 Tax=Emticicia sp. TaxID=1930953 RepID=UPI003BA810F4
MRKLFTIFFLLPLFSNAQVSFSNDKPKFGETVSFTYNPSTILANSSLIKAEAFYFEAKTVFTSSTPISLIKEGNVWKGSCELKKNNLVGLMLAFRDSTGKLIDNNKENGYILLIHDENGKPVNGAFLGLAMIQNSAMQNPAFRMKRDILEQVTFFEKEFERNPEMKESVWMNYLVALTLSKKEGYKTIIEKELDVRFDAKEPKSSELSAVAALYKQIGNKEKSEKYAQIIKKNEPKGTFVQQEKYLKIVEEDDNDKKIALFEAFEKEFPNSLMSSAMAITMISNYVSTGNITKIKEFATRYELKIRDNKASFYNTIATQMAEKNLDLKSAEAFSLKAIEAYQTEKKKLPTSSRPYDLIFRDTYATILEKQGRLKEALENYKLALGGTPEEWSNKVNESYILLAIKLGQKDEAKTMGEAFIKAGKATEKIRTAIKDLYIKSNGKKGVEAYIASLESEVKEKNKNEILSQMISEIAPNFELKDLSGKNINLTDLRGKVVILDFWATWCGPCIRSFPGMQKAQEKYKNNPNVKFLFINTWEQGNDYLPKVKKLITDKKYTDFTVPVDVDSKIVSTYKVEAIPTKFIIDPEGNIRFKRRGSSDDVEEIVEEVSLMVDALLKESKK